MTVQMQLAFSKMLTFIVKGKWVIDVNPTNRVNDLLQNPHINERVVINWHAQEFFNLLDSLLSPANLISSVQFDIIRAFISIYFDQDISRNTGHSNRFFLWIYGYQLKRISITAFVTTIQRANIGSHCQNRYRLTLFQFLTDLAWSIRKNALSSTVNLMILIGTTDAE